MFTHLSVTLDGFAPLSAPAGKTQAISVPDSDSAVRTEHAEYPFRTRTGLYLLSSTAVFAQYATRSGMAAAAIFNRYAPTFGTAAAVVSDANTPYSGMAAAALSALRNIAGPG